MIELIHLPSMVVQTNFSANIHRPPPTLTSWRSKHFQVTFFVPEKEPQSPPYRGYRRPCHANYVCGIGHRRWTRFGQPGGLTTAITATHTTCAHRCFSNCEQAADPSRWYGIVTHTAWRLASTGMVRSGTKLCDTRASRHVMS